MGIKLDPETRKRLRALGKRRDRSPHWLMKTAVIEYLDREERLEEERHEDAARWERYLETGAFLDHGEMMRWMDDLARQADRKARKAEDGGPGCTPEEETGNGA